MKNPPFPPFKKGGFKKSPFSKGGFRGILGFTAKLIFLDDLLLVPNFLWLKADR
jgi:hypothetical protein